MLLLLLSLIAFAHVSAEARVGALFNLDFNAECEENCAAWLSAYSCAQLKQAGKKCGDCEPCKEDKSNLGLGLFNIEFAEAQVGGTVDGGCHTLGSDKCCGNTDGRFAYRGQQCMKAASGKYSKNGNACEPKSWLERHGLMSEVGGCGTLVDAGCHTLSADQCCGRADGRGAYRGRECLKAASGKYSINGNACEPDAWLENKGLLGEVELCGAVKAGCHTLSKNQCCGRTDGRRAFSGATCLKAASGKYSFNGNACEPESWLESHKLMSEVEECGNGFFTPVNGGFSAWNAWSMCSKTCGNGVQTRQRECTHPAPSHGGSDCQGEHEESRACNEGPCCQVEDLLAQGNSCEVLRMNGYSTDGCGCGGCPCTQFLDQNYKCSAIETTGLDCSSCPRCQQCECTEYLAQGMVCRQIEASGLNCKHCDCSETCDAQSKAQLKAYGGNYECDFLASHGYDVVGCRC